MEKKINNTSQSQISRLRAFSFYLIMVGLSIAVSFTLLEYGLARYYHSTESQVSWTTFDATLGWRLRPGTYRVKPDHTFQTHLVSINEYGLRDRHNSVKTDREARRIVILGDSFTFAAQMPDESTFPVVLEGMLDDKSRYEVINAGVYGYGTAQEMLWMRDLADKKVVGDVYVLMIFVNDILDNLRLTENNPLEKAPSQPGFDLDEDGTLILTHHPLKEYSTNFVPPTKSGFVTLQVLRNSATTFLQTKPQLVKILNAVGVKPTMWRMPSLIFGWYQEGTLRSGLPLMKALIRAIREETERNHGTLLVSLIPSPIQVYPDVYNGVLNRTFNGNLVVESYFKDSTRPQRTVAKICEELGIPFLDLLPILARNNEKELFIPADGHFSREGHLVVAKHLSQFIKVQTAIP